MSGRHKYIGKKDAKGQMFKSYKLVQLIQDKDYPTNSQNYPFSATNCKLHE